MVKRELNPIRKTPRRVSQYGTTIAVKDKDRSFPIPQPRAHWPAFVVEDWWALWHGPHGTLFIVSDVAGLRRLFDLRSEAESFQRRIREENEKREAPMTREDLVDLLNERTDKRVKKTTEEALWIMYQAVAKEIRELEANYGLSPISRARVGLAFSEAKRAADEAAKAAVDAPPEEEDDGDDGSRPDADLPTSIRQEPVPTGIPIVVQTSTDEDEDDE